MKMTKEKSVEWSKRLVAYVLGMFLVAFGINVAITSNLGVSPVSSIPFVLSRKFTFLSLGTWTNIIYSLFVLLQLALLLKEFKWYYVFQFLVSTVFGLLVDATGLLGQYIIPDVSHYALKLVYVFISMFFIAVGITLYLEANIMSMPAEGLNVAMSKRFKWKVPTCKLVFDITVVAIATALSFLFFGSLEGIREGTVLIAFGVGLMMKPIMRFCKKPLHTLLYGKEQASALTAETLADEVPADSTPAEEQAV